MTESSKFEMGKQYRRCVTYGKTYECLFAGETIVVLSNENLEFSTKQDSRNQYTEIKPKRIYERWVNIYKNYTTTHKSKSTANSEKYADRIACIHVRQEYEEGEGL